MDLQTALPRVLSPAQGRGALWRPKFVSALLIHLLWQMPHQAPCNFPALTLQWRSHGGQGVHALSEGSGPGSQTPVLHAGRCIAWTSRRAD